METINAFTKVMSAGKKVLSGAGIFILMWLTACQPDNNSGKTDARLTQAQKDSIAKAEQEEIKKKTITAAALLGEFEDNRVSADNAFKGKTVYVWGTISGIRKDKSDQTYITLYTNNLIRKIQCYFSDEETAAKLSKDMQVTIKGKCEGLMMHVLMKDCQLISAR